MPTSRGVDGHFRGPGRQKPRCNQELLQRLDCPNSGCASFEGPGLWRRVLRRDLSKDSSTVVKWDGQAFRAFPGCVTRCPHPYPYDTISTPRDVSIFCLSFFLSFSGAQRVFGYGRLRRTVAVHPPKRGKRRLHLEEPSIGTAFARRCDIIAPELGYSHIVFFNWLADVCVCFPYFSPLKIPYTCSVLKTCD